MSSSALDSTAELLSALTPEERELLEAITARGYSLHTAITALQRTGQQTPDEVSVISNNKAVLKTLGQLLAPAVGIVQSVL